ncbi:MAG: hypothetical protein HFF06_02265 [Oscillospiraceae bacterium]|nr:hypothetical protein [Oscillospiraceae bacterium]
MAELQEQLQAILGDPEAMSQITAIARALTGGPSPEPPSPPPEAQDVDFVPVEEDPASPSQESDSGGGEAPDLGALLGMLGGGSLPDIDPRLIQIALRVFSEYSAQDDQKVALLSALKPFLREERLEKMEKAEKIARLSRVVRVAVQLLKEEDGHV